jgi:hypothetical protein
VRNDEVMRRVKEEKNIPHATQRRKVNWIFHRNCVLQHIIEGNIGGGTEVTRRY